MGFDLEDFFRKSSKSRYDRYHSEDLLRVAKKFALAIALGGVLLLVALWALIFFGWSLVSPILFETVGTIERSGLNGLLDSLRPFWERIMNGSEGMAS